MRIPANTEVLFSLTALHRDPEVFPEHMRFAPDRWLPEESHARPPGSFIPFSAGNRKCLGDRFAWAELLVAASVISRSWRLSLTPRTEIREIRAGVLRPGELLMTVKCRYQKTDSSKDGKR